MPDFDEPPRSDQPSLQKDRTSFNAGFKKLMRATCDMESILPRGGTIPWDEAENRICDYILGSFGRIPGFEQRSREIAIKLHGKEILVGGQEHLVTLDEPTQIIWKYTYGNNFGVKLDVYPSQGSIEGETVLASGNQNLHYYLKRWTILNNLFRPITKLEAVFLPVAKERLPRIVVSQTLLPLKNPRQQEIQKAFRNRGFIEIANYAYYRVKDNILIGDAAPRNIRFLGDELVPFDAIAEQPGEEAKQWCIEKAAKNR